MKILLEVPNTCAACDFLRKRDAIYCGWIERTIHPLTDGGGGGDYLAPYQKTRAHFCPMDAEEVDYEVRNVLYSCDKMACADKYDGSCEGKTECIHTRDISHAASFHFVETKEDEYYVENNMVEQFKKQVMPGLFQMIFGSDIWK